MNDQALRSIEQDIIPLKEKLRNHDLYKAIQSIEDLKIFMSIHVYSVWDFMNLIKTLQSKLTCITVPWQPVDHTENARLLNEIILEEESDEIDG